MNKLESYTPPYVDLTKCAGCKKVFRNMQETWSISYQGDPVFYSCSDCWKKYTKKKFIFAY
jgi:DNA-directed RNA polymerase subunit RPC12/RpoP